MSEMITAHVFDDIPFEPDISWLMKRLRIKEGSSNQRELLRMLDEARAIAHPRAFYLAASVNAKGDDWVEVEGVRFSSRVLRVNMGNVCHAFPYLATCGLELQEYADSLDDFLQAFWAEAIQEVALFGATQALVEDLNRQYQPGNTASMSPGSLQDWPIQEQAPLFKLFGDHAQKIGVQLTDSTLMRPNKSISGIRFATDFEFESCQLCPRDGCPGRRAAYNSELYDNRYCSANGLAQVRRS